MNIRNFLLICVDLSVHDITSRERLYIHGDYLYIFIKTDKYRKCDPPVIQTRKHRLPLIFILTYSLFIKIRYML